MLSTAPPPASSKLELQEIQNDDERRRGDIEDGNDDESSSTSSSDSSDDDSSVSSTTTSGSDGGVVKGSTFELAEITKNEVLQLPRDLCEYSSVFNEFFTEDLWNQLEPEQRVRLQAKLPDFSKLLEPAEALAEQQHTVQLLFQNRLQRFEYSPLTHLHRNLELGNYRPDVQIWRRSIAKSQRREQRFRECERIGRLAKQLFIAREQLLRSAYSAAPDEIPRLERSLQRQRLHHSYELYADTKIAAVRARKRFHAEISELKKQANISSTPNGILSADEDEPDEKHLATDADAPQGLHADEIAALKSAATTASSTDKCIYDTFYKRRAGCTDEEAMRLSQFAKRPKLTNRNFSQYLLEYKRRKLIEPNLPDFETSDIRLRDVCVRAQIGGNIKRSFPPGQKQVRKTKPKISEPPALVPIQQNVISALAKVNATERNADENQLKSLGLQQQQQPQHVSNIKTVKPSTIVHEDVESFSMIDGEVELQQEEVETYSGEYVIGNEVIITGSAPTTTITAVAQTLNSKSSVGNDRQPLPKLEPITQHATSASIQHLKDKTKTAIVAAGAGLKPTQKKTNVNATTLPTTAATSAIKNANATVVTSPNELIQETHACFFSLIRDFFCATPNHRMKFDELKQKVLIWLNNPITALNDWYGQTSNWSALLTSAIKFLAGDFADQPDEYVPYIELKLQLNIYQWIGAGRDSDARLTALCNYWMEHRKELQTIKSQVAPVTKSLNVANVTNVAMRSNLPTVATESPNEAMLLNTPTEANSAGLVAQLSSPSSLIATSPPPPPRCPTTWTVRASTTEETIEFQRQERERFEQPHRAYTYRMHGYESIVGPVRGIYTQTLALAKARGHNMMVDDRPNFVTILTLVRDATARLPNGEGTRADISELLKCSQYINPDAAENVMQTIVSGALDRLHTESDPCVRYDPKRKIWIYLHRNRSEAEFELMHQKQQGQQKPTKIVKSTPVSTGITLITNNATTTSTPNLARKITKTIVTKTLPPPVSGLALPALVPANPIFSSHQAAAATINKQQQQQMLPKNALPVPPLKYNIPATAVALQQQQQQKSLLKSAINPQQQRRIIDAKTGAQLSAKSVQTIHNSKQLSLTATAAKLQGVNSSTNSGVTNPTANPASVPVIVATASGLQTMHVSNTLPMTTSSNVSVSGASLTATVAGKRVALNKPIIINQISGKTQQQLQQQQQQQLNSAPNRAKATQILTTATTKPIIQQQQPQSYIIPISVATQSNVQHMQQLQQQHQLLHSTPPQKSTQASSSQTSSVQTIVMDPNATVMAAASATAGSTTPDALKTTPKNIIRFVPNVKQQIVGANAKIIGQRVLTAAAANSTSTSAGSTITTVRGSPKMLNAVVNAKVASTSGSAGTSTITTTAQPGTILKMSQQAFNALQQKQQQGQQHIVKTAGTTTAAAVGTQQPRQRLIIGNTAIIAHGNNSVGNKNVILQQTQQTSTQTPTKIATVTSAGIAAGKTTVVKTTTPTGVSGGNKIQMLNTTNLTPQQQRMLIQNLKQQQQLQQQQGGTPYTVVVSQAQDGLTRIIKTPPAKGTTTPTQTAAAAKMLSASTSTTGQVVTLEHLLQQQQQQQHNKQQQQQTLTISESNSTQIINSTPTVGTQFTVTPVSQSPRGIITLGSTTQQRLITTSQAATSSSTTTNVAVGTTSGGTVTSTAAGGGGGGTLRVIHTASSTGNVGTPTSSGPTTFSIANIQGKQVVFATKTPPTNIKQLTNTTTSVGGGGIANSVIIGGQTLKLQGNSLQALTKATAAGNASTATVQTTQQPQQMQTVIMGNQILRVVPTQSLSQTLITSKSAVKAEAIGANTTVQNRLVTVGTASKTLPSGTTLTTTTTLPKTLVFGSTVLGNTGGTQTTRLQSVATGVNVAAQQDATTPKSTTSGNRVVLAVPGGGQILLPTNFTAGGTLNLKSLQNMKLVSLTQMPQQQSSDKTKSSNNSAISVINATALPKTVVKTVNSSNNAATS